MDKRNDQAEGRFEASAGREATVRPTALIPSATQTETHSKRMKHDILQPNGPGLAGRGFPTLTWIRETRPMLPVLSAILMLASPGNLAAADVPFFLEDFEDGDATDGSPVTWVPGSTFAAGSTGTVVGGSYVLTTRGPSGVEADEPASIGDVSIRALVRGLSVGSGSYISFSAHGQPDGSSHWALVTQLGLHTGYTVGHNSPTVVGTVFQPGAFDPFSGDVNIQFDVVGKNLSLTVWRPGAAKPSQPQLKSTVPTTLPRGRVGFGTNYRQIAIRSFDAIRIGDSVLPPPAVDVQLNPGIVIQGTEGLHYQVEWRDALTPDSPWQLLEDIPSLPSETCVVYDPTPAFTTNRRFYQVVLVP